MLITASTTVGLPVLEDREVLPHARRAALQDGPDFLLCQPSSVSVPGTTPYLPVKKPSIDRECRAASKFLALDCAVGGNPLEYLDPTV